MIFKTFISSIISAIKQQNYKLKIHFYFQQQDKNIQKRKAGKKPAHIIAYYIRSED